MKQYQIEKTCHLGKKGESVQLPERAAAHLVAARLIAPVKEQTNKRGRAK